MVDATEVTERRDTMGRLIHASRRGPKPQAEHERTTQLLQARIPNALYEEVLRRADDHPGAGVRRNGSGRGGVVKDALETLFYGDEAAWRVRYRSEMSRRAIAEQRATELEARLAAMAQRAEVAERRLKVLKRRAAAAVRMLSDE